MKEVPYQPQKSFWKKKEKKIKPTKAYALIFQTSSEGLKVSTQLYQKENKELKMKLGMENFKMKCQEILYQLKPILVMTLNSLFWKPIKEKISPFITYLMTSRKNIYNLLQIMLNIIPWLYVNVCHLHQNLQLLMMVRYNEQTRTEFVILPSRYRLRDYKNYIQKQSPKVFYKKDNLKNLAKLTRKHLCQCRFFNKVAGQKVAISFKIKLWHKCFPVNFAKFLRTPYSQNTFGRLLLYIRSERHFSKDWQWTAEKIRAFR